MKFVALVSAVLLPVASLAEVVGHAPSPLLAADGSDLAFLLKRYDGPVPILRRAAKGKRHIVPRTLQVAEVPVRRANGLVERQQCVDAGYVPCTSGSQCCPAGSVCGPGTCCPAGNLVCAGNCCTDALGDCCPNVGCCPSGQVCFTATNGEIGCCPRGKTCTTISGCADPTTIECPGENFCCRPGTTCARDASGSATCLDSGGVTTTPTTPTGTSTTARNTIFNTNNGGGNGNIPVDSITVNSVSTRNTPTSTTSGNTNPFDNVNPFKKSAALPQFATVSGLMVTVAFLGAFLL